MLLESISDIVFHYTPLSNALNILSNDELKLSPLVISKSEMITSQTKKHYYYLSTARTKTSKYLENRQDGAYFTLDGTRLSHNYSGRPVEYSFDGTREKPTEEYEDRVHSTNKSIPILKYLIKVEILLLSGDKASAENMINTYTFCKKNNIPVTVYTNINALLTTNTKHALSHQSIIKEYEAVKHKIARDPIKRIIGDEIFNKNSTILTSVIEAALYPEKEINQYTQQTQDLFDVISLQGDKGIDLIVTTIEKQIMPNFKGTHNGKLLKLNDRIIEIMKTYKTNDIRKFLTTVFKRSL